VVDIKTGQTFALKHTRLASEPDAIKEVQQEAKTMARLKVGAGEWAKEGRRAGRGGT
jgi:hypothetical protein